MIYSWSVIRDYLSYKTLVTLPDSICFNKDSRVLGVTQQVKNTVAFCASVPISDDLDDDFDFWKFILFEFKKVFAKSKDGAIEKIKSELVYARKRK